MPEGGKDEERWEDSKIGKGEGKRSRGRRERKRVKDRGLGFSLYHSLSDLAISYLFLSSPGTFMAQLHE